jgi:uncharacterized protein GlcG (DUF336 family)
VKVTYELATRLVAAAVNAAEEMSIRIGVVVLDEGAETIATGKMDGAFRTTTSFATKKAFTALNFGVPSSVMVERIQPVERQAVIALADPRLTFIGGGVPIKDQDGIAIGAIGASGGTAEQDAACCEAALSVLSEA